ncbi:MAG: CDP-alcohol phosphatidyltransferase family protein [Methylococcaceae bacterium]|jgi:CDP-diacylglycerol--glycerol-3-phosphate 3-phosphatidyltransferase|nr:CDP-alcohol phosphatidyltransferase family protein [Methylococcaceae bacterium]MDZ4157752.1 CDP-alcohol phosphatidyltransferase family protein [Methylococcales bacterium]MDP2392095.1 CDP-alcohol phosphatidyltransferase family protein [Methylococcaceae bacterium]MDP3020853.1 CDP-alcohol phosphatidyltransferase family protein [Methylococcaceae bacterium]MDP3391671.1 CDP-alcohol phosphatidyltransferase family protein [Methylococcaceae bacterium]
MKTSRWTLPNLLTGFRFVAAPVLLWLAWHGYGIAFMMLLAIAFLTDLLDGFAARLSGQVSEFGATLDSWADVITYLTIAICCWWLWPEVVGREWLYVLLVVASCLLPAIAGVVKFGCFTSYHTWAVKLAAASMGSTLYVLFLGGPEWPFRIAAVVCILAAIEELLLTLILAEPESNVRSIWFILRRHSH